METKELKEKIIKFLEHLADQIDHECEMSYHTKTARGETFSKKSYKNIYLHFLERAYTVGLRDGYNKGYNNGRDVMLKSCTAAMNHKLELLKNKAEKR